MYYSSNPISDTVAEALIVPVNLEGKIFDGTLQTEVLEALGENYRADFVNSLLQKQLRPGWPTIYYHDYLIPQIINFPVEGDKDRIITIKEIMAGLMKVCDTCKQDGISTVAVPWLTPDYSWDIQESLLHRIETMMNKQTGVEFWLYPPEDVEDEFWGVSEDEIVEQEVRV